MDKEMKLAVLIDAENVASKYIGVILSEANVLGNVIYRRIYGNWTTPQMGAWREAILEHSIQPIQQYSNTSGKNATDSALIIDAMDLLYLGRLNGFCIVSSDSDFTRLASRLRESEMFVLGMGEQKTPRSFISACNKFSYLDILYAAGAGNKAGERAQSGKLVGDAPAPEAALRPGAPQQAAGSPKPDAEAAEQAAVSNLELICLSLRELAEENSDDEGWIFSGKLGSLLSKRFPDFDVRIFGHKKFVPFITSLGVFRMKKDERDPSIVYFKLK